MGNPSIVRARLTALGIDKYGWFAPEVSELIKILHENESLINFVRGKYHAGYAAMIATDKRLLIIDKRAFFTKVEDIRYDSITEIDFSSSILAKSVNVFTMNKQHTFSSIKDKLQLENMTYFLQQKITENKKTAFTKLQPVRNIDSDAKKMGYVALVKGAVC